MFETTSNTSESISLHGSYGRVIVKRKILFFLFFIMCIHKCQRPPYGQAFVTATREPTIARNVVGDVVFVYVCNTRRKGYLLFLGIFVEGEQGTTCTYIVCLREIRATRRRDLETHPRHAVGHVEPGGRFTRARARDNNISSNICFETS